MKPTTAQRAALVNLAEGRPMDAGISGQSAYGGLAGTAISLNRRGWVQDGAITPAGLAAIGRAAAPVPAVDRADILVKCTRCRHQHKESERLEKPRRDSGIAMSELVCPRCGCKSFYDLSPQVAWCWSSGLIEVGEAMPADKPDGSGAIEIATGPAYALKTRVAGLARRGLGQSGGQMLVPGVPEAETEPAKVDALAAWLTWCGKLRPKDGVVFSEAVAAEGAP